MTGGTQTPASMPPPVQGVTSDAEPPHGAPSPIWIELSQRGDGKDIARHGSHCAESRKGATMALARMLVAAGFPDGPWQAGRAGRVCLSGASLHRLAGITCAESAGVSLRIAKWIPLPLRWSSRAEAV